MLCSHTLVSVARNARDTSFSADEKNTTFTLERLLEAKLFNVFTTSTLIDATAILNGGTFETRSAAAAFPDKDDSVSNLQSALLSEAAGKCFLQGGYEVYLKGAPVRLVVEL